MGDAGLLDGRTQRLWHFCDSVVTGRRIFTAGLGTATTHISSNVGVDVVRFGVNYLFNFGGPAYAY